MPWAIKWRSKNKLDGACSYLMGEPLSIQTEKSGYKIMCFETRELARDYVRRHYSYIKHRKDLHKELHGWKMPQVVKVTVEVKECQ